MKINYIFFAICIAGICGQIKADTLYTWRGTVNSVFTNSANWQSSVAGPYDGTFADRRLQVYNGTGKPLYYTANEGYTIYQNLASGKRSLFIGSGTSGSMYITGGTFEGQSNSSDGMSYNGDGTLVIDGGSFLKVTGSTGFTVKYGGTGTGTLTVSNGLFEVGSLMIGGATFSGDAKGVINLDGGTTRVDKVYADYRVPSGGSIININGGILAAHKDETKFLQGLSEANVLAGGVLIDTAEYSITIDQDLLAGGGNGGLIKSGEGWLHIAHQWCDR
ncbi:MAG: hypothetical protein PF904_09715 [Kiritimatiellae bacterium]|jgi:hypothetical protein|nr:hypothetical protein [Kiritimatiellia bacterium]